ncbi:MAG: hypothetical protein P8Y70_02970 [Candidatus Lokiarchaeota archaeon]
MDTAMDFIQPEFLNILFFQQKNLVIFPYIDKEYLRALELFTDGYTSIDFTEDQMGNPSRILASETYGPYAHERNFYIVSGLKRVTLKKVLKENNARVILQTNENVKDLANGSEKYIFYNKKTKKFLNLGLSEKDLEFETQLILNSKSQEMLQDKIHQIKIAGSRIFQELNEFNKDINLEKILHTIDRRYWDKIFQFVENFYEIEIPQEVQKKLENYGEVVKQDFPLLDFSDEYEQIVSINHQLGSLFIQHLHEWRQKHVNPSNLDIKQLFHPNQLYNYLRKRHWKDGVSKDFIEDYIIDCQSNHLLNESDVSDLEHILTVLGLNAKMISKLISNVNHVNIKDVVQEEEILVKSERDISKLIIDPPKSQKSYKEDKSIIKVSESIPSIEDFSKFKKWLLKKLNCLDIKLKTRSS